MLIIKEVIINCNIPLKQKGDKEHPVAQDVIMKAETIVFL